MFVEPKRVDSSQKTIHKNLSGCVLKHLESDYKKPIQDHNNVAYEQLEAFVSRHSVRPLILDSCCGTAMSSLILASNNPDALVIGVDQSSHRLAKGLETSSDNLLLLQANCEDIWRLCLANNRLFDEHYILYPNPYPKSVHYKRRWSGHPVFPVLPKISSKLEVRSNWHVYIEEMCQAWHLVTGKRFECYEFHPLQPLTLFEKKYSEVGQILYKAELYA